MTACWLRAAAQELQEVHVTPHEELGVLGVYLCSLGVGAEAQQVGAAVAALEHQAAPA